MATPTDFDAPLKRLGGGRWQTRDARFTIEPQSGTWVVVDAEQTDDLGLPLVRGPFGSLTAAKEAIGAAREAQPAVSPLAAHVARLRERPAKDDDASHEARARSKAKPDPAREAAPAKLHVAPKPAPKPRREPPPEPRWLRDLDRSERRRADRLIAALTAAGARDPEGMARRDIVGKVPAAAAFAIARALDGLGPDAAPGAVARLLADGHDPDLGIRWRLVDGDGRPIDPDLRAPGSR